MKPTQLDHLAGAIADPDRVPALVLTAVGVEAGATVERAFDVARVLLDEHHADDATLESAIDLVGEARRRAAGAP